MAPVCCLRRAPMSQLDARRTSPAQLVDCGLDILPASQTECISLQSRLFYPLGDDGLGAETVDRDQVHRGFSVICVHHILLLMVEAHMGPQRANIQSD